MVMKQGIIESTPHEMLDDRERYWINEFNSLTPNGYNCSSGGNSKKELSECMKNKISNSVIDNRIRMLC